MEVIRHETNLQTIEIGTDNFRCIREKLVTSIETHTFLIGFREGKGMLRFSDKESLEEFYTLLKIAKDSGLF